MRKLFLVALVWVLPLTGAIWAVSPEAAVLLRDASHDVAGQDSITVNITFAAEIQDGETVHRSEVVAAMILGKAPDANIHLKAEGQEIRIFNTSEARVVHVVNENVYRELDPEPDRHRLIAGLMTGPVEYACTWLAAYLHNALDLPEMHYGGVSENDVRRTHQLAASYPDYDLLVSLSDSEPPLLQRVVMDIEPSVAAAYVPVENGRLRIIMEVSQWEYDVAGLENRFVFSPPPGVQKAGESASDTTPAAPTPGEVAPDFSLDMLDGGSMQLSSHIDEHIVILDFWASWCGPCRSAMPIVARVAEQFKDKGVVLYAVNLRETPERARTFLDSINVSLKVPMDKTGAVAARYDVAAIPRLVLIGKDGKIKKIHAGMSPDMEQELTRDIQGLLQ